jgi:hypothetical protein
MDSAASTTSSVIENLNGWIKQPFNSSMGAGGWFLFFGLIAAISVAWGIILKDLRGDL